MPTDKKHYRVSYANAIAAHEVVLNVSGGRAGILNESNLLSALARPYCGYFPEIEDKASALLEAIVQNHGFVDGNKRTATFLVFLLISASGYVITPVDDYDDTDLGLENLVVDLAAGNIKRDIVTQWFARRCHPA